MSTDVRLERVTKAFGETVVLDGLDLVVPAASIVAILGASGSGKTTLLRLVAGFEAASGGVISIGNEVVDDGDTFRPPERRHIGYVAQEGALFPHLTVARNIAFGLRRDAARAARVEELLALVGMEGLGGRYPHELSGGQQRRVALARALAPSPRVVLLDEPFSALDAGLRASLRAEVASILRAARITTILVTHDQEEALSVAELVGVIRQGRIRQLATPSDLYARPVDPVLAGFLGEANLLRGEAAAGVARTSLGEMTLTGSGSLEGPVTVLVRPEQIELRPAGSPPAPVSGTVVHREYYGHDSVVLVATSEPSPIRVRCGGALSVEVGDTVTLLARGETVAWPAGGPTGHSIRRPVE